MGSLGSGCGCQGRRVRLGGPRWSRPAWSGQAAADCRWWSRQARRRGPAVDWRRPPGRSGGGGWALGSSIRWAGRQPAVRATGQSPAALMDRPMMGPAHQRQILEVGRAAMEPVAQMVGLAPGRGSVAARHRTTTVADHQGGALGGGHHPAGPAHLQRLGRRTPKGWGKPGRCRPQPGHQVVVVARVAAGVASDQHSGDRPVTGQPPTRLRVQRSHPADLTPQATGAKEAVQVDGHQQLGSDPTALGQPAGLQGAAGQLDQGISPTLGRAAGVVGAGWGGPGAPGRPAPSGRPRGPAAR